MGCYFALMSTIETWEIIKEEDDIFTWRHHKVKPDGCKDTVQSRRGIDKYAHIFTQIAFGQ